MESSKLAFTEVRVKGLTCPATRIATRGLLKGHPVPVDYAMFWDESTRGLGLRVTASGARSYIFEKRVHGRTVRVTIGDPKAWKLEAARVEARRLTTVVDRQIDPRDEAAEKRAQADAGRLEGQRRGLVLAGVWAAYIESCGDKWGARHRADHVALAHAGGERKRRGKGLTKPGPLASLMPLKLSDLTAEKISGWLKREGARRPTNTAQAFRLLRAFIRWAADMPEYRGIIPADAYTARAVRDQVPRTQAKEGDCLQVEQLPAWFGGVGKISNPVISAYLQALLLTGARREELATLRWADVDFEWKGLTIRDKVDGQRSIPLTPYVAMLLEALPRKNDWVFSSATAKDGRLAEPRIAHNAALTGAGLPHVTLHGLRRSFGTLAEWVELPTGVVAQIQGHKPSAIAEKHYRRRPLDLLRVWHEKLEAWILDKGGVQFKAPAGAGIAAAA